MKLDFIDIKRAYFHAATRRDLYIKLPEEDQKEGHYGKLDKSMYGTRDEAQNWEEEYSNWLMEIGFSRGVASPCVFYHSSKNIRVVIHGDDFTLLGYEEGLDWFIEMLKKKLEYKHRGRLGPEAKIIRR